MLRKPFYALCVITKREKNAIGQYIEKSDLLYHQISVSVLSPISASLSFFYILFLSKLCKNANLDSSLF